jgi:hypothetical protein
MVRWLLQKPGTIELAPFWKLLPEIAAQVGYSSVYAFATAFRRHHGEPPRRWQEHALAATPATDPAHGIHA